jgi:hypothetical protein
MPNPVIHFRCPPEKRELIDRYGNDPGEQILNDIVTLNTLITHYARQMAGRLTTGEAMLICDVLNSHWHLPEMSNSPGVDHSVSDGIALDGLDAKWSVDGQALMAKLNAMGAIEQLVLIHLAQVFWMNHDKHEDAREYAKRLFRCEEG